MGSSVWKMSDLRMEVAPRIFALARKFGTGLVGIELLGGSGDDTAELFLLGLVFSWPPLFGSRAKAPVGEGTGCVDTWTPRGAVARSHLSGVGR
jgi:hypothetical protein